MKVVHVKEVQKVQEVKEVQEVQEVKIRPPSPDLWRGARWLASPGEGTRSFIRIY